MLSTENRPAGDHKTDGPRLHAGDPAACPRSVPDISNRQVTPRLVLHENVPPITITHIILHPAAIPSPLAEQQWLWVH
mgnify:CR=1 FL=1